MDWSWDAFTRLLGSLAAIGLTGTAFALFIGGMFRKAIESWINNFFETRKKAFEHEQAKELQKLKVKIDTVVQGALKLQEREFKIIPEAFEKVSEAFGLANWLCSPMQSYTSLRYMSSVELDEFLAKADLLESQKQKLRDSEDDRRDALWREMDTRSRRQRVQVALTEADKHLKVNAVFIPDELREQFTSLVHIVWEALISFDVGNDATSKDYKMIREGWEKLKKEGEPLQQQIEKAVRARLLEQTQIAEKS